MHYNVEDAPLLRTNDAGAAMEVEVFMKPTDVSFYRVRLLEEPEDASSVEGYFTDPFFTSEMLHHYPGDWFSLTETNSWTDHCWTPPMPKLGNPAHWWSGKFKWVVPAKWRVENTSSTNDMTQWEQVFTIDASGTAKITKFNDYWVQRQTNDVIRVGDP